VSKEQGERAARKRACARSGALTKTRSTTGDNCALFSLNYQTKSKACALLLPSLAPVAAWRCDGFGAHHVRHSLRGYRCFLCVRACALHAPGVLPPPPPWPPAAGPAARFARRNRRVRDSFVRSSSIVQRTKVRTHTTQGIIAGGHPQQHSSLASGKEEGVRVGGTEPPRVLV
jgi:hypothetical protein